MSTQNNIAHASWDLHYPYMFTTYHFSFKTPEQARDLAQYIVLLCNIKRSHLELGLNEIFLNAIEHGNLELHVSEKRSPLSRQMAIHQKLQTPENNRKKVRVMMEISSVYVLYRSQSNFRCNVTSQ